jgi:hypothetical protein
VITRAYGFFLLQNLLQKFGLLRLIFATRKVQPNRWQATRCKKLEFCEAAMPVSFLTEEQERRYGATP